MTILMIIDDPSNGSSGYMLLHGSNADVGGYQIEGTVNKDEKGTITYDMTYTFNDIIDPNFRYKQDKVCYNFVKFLFMIGTLKILQDCNLESYMV